MSKTNEALDAWLRARRILEAAAPWSAEWVRARQIARDRRTTYEALASDEGAEPNASRDPGGERVNVWR
jgi:hypothetical protein